MNGRKKSHSIRRTFTSSVLHLDLVSSSLYSLPAPTRIFLPLSLPFAPSLFSSCGPVAFLLSFAPVRAGVSLLIQRGAKLLMPDCTPREATKERRGKGRVLRFQKKAFRVFSLRLPAAPFRPFRSRPLLRIKRPRGRLRVRAL